MIGLGAASFRESRSPACPSPAAGARSDRRRRPLLPEPTVPRRGQTAELVNCVDLSIRLAAAFAAPSETGRRARGGSPGRIWPAVSRLREARPQRPQRYWPRRERGTRRSAAGRSRSWPSPTAGRGRLRASDCDRRSRAWGANGACQIDW